MNNKKYKLVKSETKQVGERTLYRIRALRDFGNVERGKLGGWIESEDNLSHNGECWVYGDAQVFGNARVYGKARVSGNARVYGDAWVFRNTRVSGNALVYGNARVYGKARVYGDARVYGKARVTKCLYIQQLRDDITVTDTHVFIGCQGHTWEHWSEHIEVIGRQHDYSEEEVNKAKAVLLAFSYMLDLDIDF